MRWGVLYFNQRINTGVAAVETENTYSVDIETSRGRNHYNDPDQILENHYQGGFKNLYEATQWAMGGLSCVYQINRVVIRRVLTKAEVMAR